MNDLTVIMLTANKVPEGWAQFHKTMLLEAIGDTPLITVSFKPLDWGLNLIQTEYSITNVYQQMLRAAKIATTPYIATADDDTLYSYEHYSFRPPMDKFAYNFTRWHVRTWGYRSYFLKQRPGNGLLIAPRELAISALEARFAKRKVLEGLYAKELGTVPWLQKHLGEPGYVSFYSYDPVVSFYHGGSIDPFNQHKSKAATNIRAYDIPKWGHVKTLMRHFA